jgi:hypothetical protein
MLLKAERVGYFAGINYALRVLHICELMRSNIRKQQNAAVFTIQWMEILPAQ